MAKILVTFFNGVHDIKNPYAMPIFYEALLNGLHDNGNEVFAVMHRYWNRDFGEIPKELSLEIKNFNPDLVFTFNNAFYDLSRIVDCPIVVYEVDSPLYYSNKESLKINPSRYKFFVAASTSDSILTDEFNVPKKNIIQVPFFTEIQAENLEKKYNICFIGTKFGDNWQNCMHRFMSTNPSDNERHEFIELVKQVEREVFVQKDELLKNITSQKIIDTFDPVDLVGILSAHRRLKTLSGIADLGLDIWGTPNWMTDIYNEPWIMLNYHQTPAYSIEDNQYIYNSSKIGFNIGHLQAKNGFPWRVFDILASNACLVTEYHKDFDKYIPNLKLPFYSNMWEAREQCIRVLKDENYRLDIIKQSQEIINKNYRFINSLRIMENYLGLKLINEKQKNNIRILSLEEFEEHTKVINTQNHNFVSNLKIKNRFKVFVYSLLLALAQIPVLDLLQRRERRNKLHQKIDKYWR